MAEKISEIKDKFSQAKENELETLIGQYLDDERNGVKQEIQKARRRILQLEEEIQRTSLLWKYEKEYCEYSYICGIDEVGRGPLAGPVVCASVIMPLDDIIQGIDDSKKISEKKREQLFVLIKERNE